MGREWNAKQKKHAFGIVLIEDWQHRLSQLGKVTLIRKKLVTNWVMATSCKLQQRTGSLRGQ
jgi:hypothetical protein